MNANHILDALEMIDDTYIMGAKERNAKNTAPAKNAGKKVRSLRRALALVAQSSPF